MRTLHAEALKLISLPSTWIATALALTLPPLLAFLNANMLHRALSTGDTGALVSTSTVDEGFGQLTYGLVGVVILGVIALSSEYTRNAKTVGAGRQISTTMMATPKRGLLLTSKLVVLMTWVCVVAAMVIPTTVLVSQARLGPYATNFSGAWWHRSLAVLAYWVVTALIAFALAAWTRNGIIPLVLLLTNVSMVSFSLLAAQITSEAKFLPDMAAYSTFMTEHPMAHPLSTLGGLATLAIWGASAGATAYGMYLAKDA